MWNQVVDSLASENNLVVFRTACLFPEISELAAWYFLRFDPEVNVVKLMDFFAEQPEVVHVHPNPEVVLFVPNDPGFFNQPFHQIIGSDQIWDDGNGIVGDPNVVIAVIDGSFTVLHPDLATRIMDNPGEDELNFANFTNGSQLPPARGEPQDDDNNGFWDDDKGWDFSRAFDVQEEFSGDNNVFPNMQNEQHPRHGNWVASIAAAQTNDGLGFLGGGSGIAGGWWPDSDAGCRILPVQCGRPSGESNRHSALEYAAGILYAADFAEQHEVKMIINMSFGVFDLTEYIHENHWEWDYFGIVFNYLANLPYADNILLVAAAGNFGESHGDPPFGPEDLQYPASFPKVISVGGTDHLDRLFRMSTRNDSVAIAAPMDQIWGALGLGVDLWDIEANYGSSNGTSAASPMVAGAAALLWSSPQWEDLTSDELRHRLVGTAYSVIQTDPYGSMKLGAGRLDIPAAMSEPARPRLVVRDVEIDSEDGDEYIFAGESASIRIKLKNFWESTGSTVSGTMQAHVPEIVPVIGQNSHSFGILETDQSAWSSGEYGILTSTTAETDTYFVTLHLQNSGNYSEDILIPVPVFGRPLDPIEILDHQGYVFAQTMADVDNDGLQELIWGTQYHPTLNHSLYVMESDGDYVFTDIDANWDIMTKPAVGNIDGDYRLEIVAIATRSNPTQTRLYIWNHDLSQAFPPILVANQSSSSDPVLADLNSDGKLDVLVATNGAEGQQSGVYAYTYSTQQQAIVPLWQSAAQVTGGITVAPAVGDLDGDFTNEIAVCASAPMYLHFLNGEDGSVARAPVQVQNNGTAFRGAPIIADLEKCAGDVEIVLSTFTQGTPSLDSNPYACVYRWNGNSLCCGGEMGSLLETPNSHLIQSLLANMQSAPPDILEIVTPEVSNASGNQVINPGCQTVSDDLGRLPHSIHAVSFDVNGDGHRDIVGGGFSGPGSNPSWGGIATMNTLGEFTEGWQWPFCDASPFQSTPALGDWDGDGTADITFIAAGAGIRVYSLETASPINPVDWDWSQENVDVLNSGLYSQSVEGTIPAGSVVTWHGKVNLLGTVVVPTGATLNIMPGTVVYGSNSAAIDVLGGTLNVRGLPNDSVYFVKGCSGAGWEGIHNSGGVISISYAHIEGAHFPVFVENPQGQVPPVLIHDSRIVGGEIGLRLWGNFPFGYTVLDVIVQDIEAMEHYSGIYFLNAYVNCYGLQVLNSANRTGLVRNSRGLFADCVFSGPTTNYGLVFDAVSSTSRLGCCTFDHIGSQTPGADASIISIESSPILGYAGSTVNNRIVDDVDFLLQIGGEAPYPVISDCGNSFEQENIASGGRFFQWVEPPSNPDPFDASGSYFSTWPEIDYFDPDDEDYWDLTDPLGEYPGLCPEESPLDDGEQINPLAVGLQLEADSLFEAALESYMNLAQLDTIASWPLRCTAFALAVSVDRMVSTMSVTERDIVADHLLAGAETKSDSLTVQRIRYANLTHRGLFEESLSAHEELFGWGLDFVDSLKIASDIIEIQLLALGSGGSLDALPQSKYRELAVSDQMKGIRMLDDALEMRLHTNASGSTSSIPSTFELYQNYPNPFNPNTEIRFDIPEVVRVELKIFNILGQEVTTLVDDLRAAGAYRILWDGKNAGGLSVASGVYVYQLKAGNFQDAKKMVLLR